MHRTPRLLVCAALLSVAPLAARADDGPPAPAGPVVLPQPIADEAKRASVLAVVDALRDEAARVRGLAWKQRVPAEVISRDEMLADFLRMVKEDLKPEVYEPQFLLARRLGMLAPAEDPIAISLSFLREGVLGYYDTKRKHFFVVDGPSPLGMSSTILHELVHALEDQYVDFDAQEKPIEEDGDRMFALACVHEGSAEHARRLFERRYRDAARAHVREQGSGTQAMVTVLTRAPAFLYVPTLLEYQLGPAFVRRAVGDDFTGGMARLYADVPRSQEQVMHPGRYLAARRDLPRRIELADAAKAVAAALGAGWRAGKPLALGELDLALWFDHWLGGAGGRLSAERLGSGAYVGAEATRAAEGGDGARFVLLDGPGGAGGVAAVLAFDGPADAREGADAIARCLSTRERTATGRGGLAGATRLDVGTGATRARVGVEGEVVRFLDGVPEAALDAGWAALAAAKVTREEGDTWTPADEPDALAGAAWRSAGDRAGWVPPGAGWTWSADGDAFVARNGELEVRLAYYPGTDLQASMAAAGASIRARFPAARPGEIEDREVVGRSSAAVPFDDRGRGPTARGRVLVVVPLGDGLVALEASAPKAVWASLQALVEEALDGLRV